MRYMTREVFLRSQPIGVNATGLRCLRASKRAQTFSEEYFRALYRRKLRVKLRRAQEWSAYSFEDDYPDYAGDFDDQPEDYDMPEAYERARMEYEREREELRANWEPYFYDEAEERARFEEVWREQMEALRNDLPEEILAKVADLRVLALGMAAPEVKREIRRFERERERRVANSLREYQRQYDALCARHPGSFPERFHFHDDVIEDVRRRGENLIVRLSHERWRTQEHGVDRITFVRCEVLRWDAALRGADWLYEEIYEAAPGWEIHVLAISPDNDLAELILRCEDVRLE